MTPRLIFADYLDEHGERRRATLIRRMIAAPTYTFFWSRRCKWPRHIHSEPIRAIRGLLGEVWPVCEREWDRWPEVESIIYRRGFAEGVVMRSFNFLRLAIQFFPLHPIQDVLLWDLPPVHISERRGWTRAALVRDGFGTATGRPSCSPSTPTGGNWCTRAGPRRGPTCAATPAPMGTDWRWCGSSRRRCR